MHDDEEIEALQEEIRRVKKGRDVNAQIKHDRNARKPLETANREITNIKNGLEQTLNLNQVCIYGISRQPCKTDQ